MILLVVSFLSLFLHTFSLSFPDGRDDTALDTLPKRLVEEAIPIYDDDFASLPRNGGRRRRMRTGQTEPFKRPSFHPWAGKRSQNLQGSESTKRSFQPWGGKRSGSKDRTETEELQEILKIFVEEIKLSYRMNRDLMRKADFLISVFQNSAKAREPLRELIRNLPNRVNVLNEIRDETDSDLRRVRRQFSAWGGR